MALALPTVPVPQPLPVQPVEPVLPMAPRPVPGTMPFHSLSNGVEQCAWWVQATAQIAQEWAKDPTG